MFDPVRAYLATHYHPVEDFNTLDEEQYAQRYGHVVRIPSLRSKFILRLGKLFIRIGEKMTGERETVELSRETA